MNYFSVIAGGAVSRIDPDSTGLHPSWRKALVHASFIVEWAEGTPSSEIEKLRAEVALGLKKVSDLMPGAGSYFNEVCTQSIIDKVVLTDHFDYT
jgi:hypothetical protein